MPCNYWVYRGTFKGRYLFLREIHLRIDDELERKLKALAAGRGEPMAVVIRNLLNDSLSAESAVTSLNVIVSAVRNVIRKELKPLEERLAKINAKTSIASATSMYLLVQVLDDLGVRNAVDIYEKARIKAIAFLKEPVKERD
jgi:predicted DNA-binding protein